MVNWDPLGKTALSDEEVLPKETMQKLYFLRYPLTAGNGYITIATTRPETIMADVAVCVNPNDDRYKTYIGKTCKIPLLGKEIPIISDEYVSMDFGTGCLKITPAHDINDYNIGIKHNLPVVDVLNEDGTLNDHAVLPQFIGKDRFKVRREIAEQLQEEGFIEKITEYPGILNTSERTGAVVEPRLSMQWFLKMEKLSKPALDNVMNDNIRFVPEKLKNTYRHWMENVKDWCVSRQLWWGQRIPAWYNANGDYVVAKTAEEANELFSREGKSVAGLRQDEDVLDTWFSSWLWPISVFDGFKDPKNADINYYYPTQDLVTAPEIMFFWVARMIIAGYEYRGEKPFSTVYYTGIVRDKQGRKMSKSLGNSPDPLDLIEKYGADGVRLGMLLCSPAGNDIPFDEKQVEQGRNFCNKIWNAFRLVKGWEVNEGLQQPSGNATAIKWFEARLQQVLIETEDDFDKYRISDALMSMYKLIWDDFCAWYLEMIKPAFGQPIDRKTYDTTVSLFEKLMKMLHPIMPFITEEIWHGLKFRNETDCITISSYPQLAQYEKNILETAENAIQLISEIRNNRNANGLSPKENLGIFINSNSKATIWLSPFQTLIEKLANVSGFETSNAAPEFTKSLMIKTDEFYLRLPESVFHKSSNEEIQKELDYLKGFLNSVNAKLNNEKFVAHAKPELLEKEKQKQADALLKIAALEKQLRGN